MGVFMREALKGFCRGDSGGSGWCYAVFWKINCRNPMLLMWEEGHYEPTRCSAFSSISALENPELLIKEWEAVWNPEEIFSFQVKAQTEDKIGKIFDQMNHQVHVRGQGIVGFVASIGKHQWVIRETYMGKGHSEQPIDCIVDSQSFAWCQQQFSAGIQTIAVIPVFPDGVVQLASTQQITENLEFVSQVQMLNIQLKSAQGTFLPGSTKKNLAQKFQMRSSQRTTSPAMQSKNLCARVGTPLPVVGNSCERQSLLKRSTSRFVGQPTTIDTQIYKNMLANNSAVPLTSAIDTTTIKAFGDIFQQKDLPSMNPSIPVRIQLENGTGGAQVIISNPNVQVNRQLARYNPSSGSSDQISVISSGVLASSKAQQVLSCVGFEGHLSNNKTSSNTTCITLPNPCGNTVVNSSSGHNIGNCNLTPFGTWRSVESHPSVESVGVLYANLPTVPVGPVSKNLNTSNNSPLISGGSQPGLSSTLNNLAEAEQATKQGQIDTDLCGALDFRLVGSDGVEHLSWSRSMDSLEGSLNPRKGSQDSANSSFEESRNARALCGQTIKNSHNYEGMIKVEDNPLDALGADFKINPLYFSWDDLLAQEGKTLTGASTCISDLSLVPGFDDSESGYFSQAKSDLLLDAVVSKFCAASNQNSDDNLSCKTGLTKITSPSVDVGSTSYRPSAAPLQKQGELFGLSQALTNAEGTGCSIKSKEGSQNDGASKSQISLWVEDAHIIKHDCCSQSIKLNGCSQSIKHDSCSISHSKKAEELGKSNRKRPRPGDSSRPRPKDRQMIQDRVKELREIVPNGAKCSIDALLENTIKHLLFLQSVTKHADKLKQTSESKLINKEGGLLLRDKYEGGATLAFEVGSQSVVYPIIVEDLSHPRQMLVEMLCEEQGFFLEIADIIRGLGLTILKGLMEVRSDKVWAWFAVEANRDVTRFDVSLSLARLLEQSKGSLPPKSIRDSRKPAVQSTSQQATHSTGLVEILQ